MDRGDHGRRPGGGRRGDLVVPARPHRPHHDRHQHRRPAARVPPHDAAVAAATSTTDLERRRPDDDGHHEPDDREHHDAAGAAGAGRLPLHDDRRRRRRRPRRRQPPVPGDVDDHGHRRRLRHDAALDGGRRAVGRAHDVRRRGGVQLQRFVSLHHFFGTDDTETSTCDGQPRPLGAAAGTTWTARCVDGDETATWTGTVVGAETATVGGEQVDVEHVVVTIDDGDARDSQRTETWYLAGTDLVVRRISDITTTEGSPVGDVHYTEHYEISLDSLSPLG